NEEEDDEEDDDDDEDNESEGSSREMSGILLKIWREFQELQVTGFILLEMDFSVIFLTIRQPSFFTTKRSLFDINLFTCLLPNAEFSSFKILRKNDFCETMYWRNTNVCFFSNMS
ncbi:putative Nucleolar transcription factor 1 protein, partial [Naja naja]